MDPIYTDIYVEELKAGESFLHEDGEIYEISYREVDDTIIRFSVECLSSVEGADELVFLYGDTVKGQLV